MSLALPPSPPRHRRRWLAAPLHIPMLPSVAQSSAPVLPSTEPGKRGAEQGGHGRAQLHTVWFWRSPNG